MVAMGMESRRGMDGVTSTLMDPERTKRHARPNRFLPMDEFNNLSASAMTEGAQPMTRVISIVLSMLTFSVGPIAAQEVLGGDVAAGKQQENQHYDWRDDR